MFGFIWKGPITKRNQVTSIWYIGHKQLDLQKTEGIIDLVLSMRLSLLKILEGLYRKEAYGHVSSKINTGMDNLFRHGLPTGQEKISDVFHLEKHDSCTAISLGNVRQTVGDRSMIKIGLDAIIDMKANHSLQVQILNHIHGNMVKTLFFSNRLYITGLTIWTQRLGIRQGSPYGPRGFGIRQRFWRQFWGNWRII